jgi:hypothetical protein
MPVDEKLLLYSLAQTFNTTLGVKICSDTKAYLKKTEKKFNKLELNDKIYFTKYALKLAQGLADYLDEIVSFELNTDPEHEVVHDFRLIRKKKNECIYVSTDHNSIIVRDLIPEKLMRICKYKKNTNICKAYLNGYEAFSKKAYKKISSHDKYSDLKDKTKNSVILEPLCNLVVETIAKKRKCAANLYDHLFGEQNRIVLRLYKNRFTIYDFSKELENEVESYKMKLTSSDGITITFNNGAKFTLVLHTNATEIKEHLSLKFHTNFVNMDELYSVSTSNI